MGHLLAVHAEQHHPSFRALPPGSSTDFVGSSRRQIKLRPRYGSVKQRNRLTRTWHELALEHALVISRRALDAALELRVDSASTCDRLAVLL